MLPVEPGTASMEGMVDNPNKKDGNKKAIKFREDILLLIRDLVGI